MFLWLCSFGYVPLVMFLCASRGDWGFYFSSQMITSSKMTQSSRCSGVKPTRKIPCGDFGKKKLEMLRASFASRTHGVHRLPACLPACLPAKISYPGSPGRVRFRLFYLLGLIVKHMSGCHSWFWLLLFFSPFYFLHLFSSSKCGDLTNSLKIYQNTSDPPQPQHLRINRILFLPSIGESIVSHSGPPTCEKIVPKVSPVISMCKIPQFGMSFFGGMGGGREMVAKIPRKIPPIWHIISR